MTNTKTKTGRTGHERLAAVVDRELARARVAILGHLAKLTPREAGRVARTVTLLRGGKLALPVVQRREAELVDLLLAAGMRIDRHTAMPVHEARTALLALVQQLSRPDLSKGSGVAR